MKKMTTSLLLFLLGFFGLVNQVKAQSNPILVPTYQSQTEMPPKTKPAQKLLKQLPLVVINENGADFTLFESEMNQWKVKNPSVLNQLDKSVIDLINEKKYEKLAEMLIEMGHSKELSIVKYKGGKDE
jgi:hypothetical protein